MTDGSVGASQRFTVRNPCPICTGHANMPQGKGIRCYGFISEDEEWAHCSRTEDSGSLEQDSAQTYAHKLHGPCACGAQHGEPTDEHKVAKGPTPIGQARRAQAAASAGARPPDHTYEYRDAAGKIVAIKGRWNLPAAVEGEKDDKDIKWRVPESEKWDGTRKYGFGVDEIPLYHAEKLAQLAPGALVYFCEGEKACDACESSGLVDWRKSGVTTLPGGAAQTKFGKSLDLLEGFHLRPWGDNDVAGRKLMRTVRAVVEHIVLSWRPVVVSLPEAGDAHDYFYPKEGSGYAAGTLSEIENQSLSAPVREHINGETIRVTCPTMLADSPAVFTFSELERRRREINAVVQVQVLNSAKRRTLQYDIDLLSISKVSSYRLLLDKTFGDQYEWTDLLTTAINELRVGWAASSPLTDSATIPQEDDDALVFAVDRILPWGEHSILFGRRDSTKSYMALMLACCASLGLPFAGLQTKCEGPWLYIDNETNQKNWGRRLRRCWKALGFTADNYPRGKVFYKNARGLSMPDMVDDLIPKCDEHGVVGIIQDSVIAALGGDPLNPQDVSRYCSAVDRFERTFISIAHIPKDTLKEPDDPFGSIVFANKVRACLRVTRSKHQPDKNVVSVTVTPTKGNDIPDKRPLHIEVSFDGDTGAVGVRQQRMNDVPNDLNENSPLKWRIWQALMRSAMTASEITERLNDGAARQVEVKTVKDTCYQMTQPDANPNLIALDQSVGGRGKEVRYGRMAGAPRALPTAVGQSRPVVINDPEEDIPFG